MNSSSIETNRQPTTGQSLIPVKQGAIGGVPTMVCDGRELHAFLGNRDHFSMWIRNRIEKFGFEENQDFTIASGNSEAKRGGSNRKDYTLALDMAKELAMVENNDQGRRARRYFIDMERRALTLSQKARPSMTAQYPQQGTTTLSYEGFKFRIIWLQGSPWFAAIDVCRALVLRDSNTILRYLPAEQKQKIRSGKSDIHIISLAGFNIATLRGEERRADKLRRWVDNALTTAMSPENALDNLIPESYERSQEPAVRTYSEDAMLQLIGRKRFCATMEPDGGLRLREIPDGVFMLKPTEMPGWISDPAGCPQEILPQLLVAISQRMGARALH
jgi:phage anti-repressor protein